MSREESAETDIRVKQRAWRFTRLSAWLSPSHVRFWLVVGLVLYSLVGFFLAPWLIERVALKSISEVGRSLKIGVIKVNPFVLGMELQDVGLRDQDAELLFACDKVYVNLELSSLFHWAWTFRELQLVKPYLNLERYRSGDDRISALIRAFAGQTAPADEVTGASANLPRLILRHLKLSHGKVVVTDHVQDREFKAEFGPIHASIDNLNTLPDHVGRQQVSISTRSGGSIAWTGMQQLSPLLLQGRLTVSGPVLEGVNRYLALLLPFGTQAGGVDASFDYRIMMGRQQGIEAVVENITGIARDIRVQLADDGGEVIRLPEVKFAGGALHWPENKISLNTLAIDAARLSIARLPDGSFDLQGLLPVASATAVQANDTDPAGADAEGAWSMGVRQFAVTGAAIGFTDHTMEPAATIGVHDLEFSATDISNRPEALFPVQLELQIDGGGLLKFEGEAGALPAFSVEGEVTVNEAALATAQPWITNIAHVEVESGTASLRGRIVHGAKETAGYQGSVRIDGFELTDTNRGEQLAGVQSLASDRIQFSYDRRTVETSQLKLTRPYGRIAIAADKTTNLTGLMVGSDGESEGRRRGENGPEARPLAVTLDGFDIEDASLDFSDNSLPLPFAAAIRAMHGKVSTLSNQTAGPAEIQLEGQINEYGLARITGSINAWAFGAYADMKVTFRNLETASLSPYTIGIAGYKIAGGQLDLDLDYQLRKGKMLGTNKIVSRQLKLGEKMEVPGGTSLPLRLAVALLTDNDGVIDVDLPVSGDINDPQFRLGGVITKAILGLLGRIITSPFRFLGKLVGVDSEDFGTLHFAAGSAAISPPDREKLIKLAAAMRQRPELVLKVGGVYAADGDREALQAVQLDAELAALTAAQKPGGEELSTATRRRAAEALFQQAFPGMALEQVQAEYLRAADGDGQSPVQPLLDETAYLAGLRRRLIGREQVDNAELERLAGLRADSIIALLQDSGLSIRRVEAQAVKAAPSGEIPLELKVSAGPKSGDGAGQR